MSLLLVESPFQASMNEEDDAFLRLKRHCGHRHPSRSRSHGPHGPHGPHGRSHSRGWSRGRSLSPSSSSEGPVGPEGPHHPNHHGHEHSCDGSRSRSHLKGSFHGGRGPEFGSPECPFDNHLDYSSDSSCSASPEYLVRPECSCQRHDHHGPHRHFNSCRCSRSHSLSHSHSRPRSSSRSRSRSSSSSSHSCSCSCSRSQGRRGHHGHRRHHGHRGHSQSQKRSPSLDSHTSSDSSCSSSSSSSSSGGPSDIELNDLNIIRGCRGDFGGFGGFGGRGRHGHCRRGHRGGHGHHGKDKKFEKKFGVIFRGNEEDEEKDHGQSELHHPLHHRHGPRGIHKRPIGRCHHRFGKGVSGPEINLSEDAENYRIEVNLFGMTKDQVKVEVSADRRILSISGERKSLLDGKAEDKEKGKKNDDGEDTENQGNQKMEVDIEDENNENNDQNKSKPTITESYFGKFERHISIPENGDMTNIQSKMENGILKITIPKVETREQTCLIQIE